VRAFAACLVAALALHAGNARAELYYLIVSGIGGDPIYAERFAGEASDMAGAAERTLGSGDRVLTLAGEAATRDAVREAFSGLGQDLDASDRLAVFLIGHGSYDGTEYKFNLPGTDITGDELSELMQAVPAESQLIVNMTSASGSVLEAWSGVAGRTLITATRSGAERNATRFSEHWAKALSADDADLDKNGSISAQEAFDFTSNLVDESFESEGALATEHPELRGDTAAMFEVARLTARVAVSPEVERLMSERDALLEQIAALRLRRDEAGADYQSQMLELQVSLATIQQQIDAATGE